MRTRSSWSSQLESTSAAKRAKPLATGSIDSAELDAALALLSSSPLSVHSSLQSTESSTSGSLYNDDATNSQDSVSDDQQDHDETRGNLADPPENVNPLSELKASRTVMRRCISALRHAANEWTTLISETEDPVGEQMRAIKLQLFAVMRAVFAPNGSQILAWRDIVHDLYGAEIQRTESEIASASLTIANIATLLSELYRNVQDASLLADTLLQLDEAFPAQLIPVDGDGYESFLSHEEMVDLAICIRTQRLILLLQQSLSHQDSIDPLSHVAFVFCQPVEEIVTPLMQLDGPFRPVGDIDFDGHSELSERYQSHVHMLIRRLSHEPNKIDIESLQKDFPLEEALGQLGEMLSEMHENICASIEHWSNQAENQNEDRREASEDDGRGHDKESEQRDEEEEGLEKSEPQVQFSPEDDKVSSAGTTPEKSCPPDDAVSGAKSVGRGPSITPKAVDPRKEKSVPSSALHISDIATPRPSLFCGPRSIRHLFGLVQSQQPQLILELAKRKGPVSLSGGYLEDLPEIILTPSCMNKKNRSKPFRARDSVEPIDSDVSSDQVSYFEEDRRRLRGPERRRDDSNYADPRKRQRFMKANVPERLASVDSSPSAQTRGDAGSSFQARQPWLEADMRTLIKLMDTYQARWAQIETQNHMFLVPRNQQAYRDKARTLKVLYILDDSKLPPSFDLVKMGAKEKKRLIRHGKNPHRLSSNVDEAGNPTATDLMP